MDTSPGGAMTDPQPHVPILELVQGGRPGRRFPIKGDDLHIGRVPGLDVYLNDGKVSRDHARVERRPDGSCHLVDLGSHNGTYLDGKRLTPSLPVPLRDGSRIRVVEFELVFHSREVELREGAEDGSTVVGSLSDLSSSQLAARSARPGETLQAVLEVNRARRGGRSRRGHRPGAGRPDHRLPPRGMRVHPHRRAGRHAVDPGDPQPPRFGPPPDAEPDGPPHGPAGGQSGPDRRQGGRRAVQGHSEPDRRRGPFGAVRAPVGSRRPADRPDPARQPRLQAGGSRRRTSTCSPRWPCPSAWPWRTTDC